MQVFLKERKDRDMEAEEGIRAGIKMYSAYVPIPRKDVNHMYYMQTSSDKEDEKKKEKYHRTRHWWKQ